ncbi:hypothetical protein PsAD2_03414 [Pseudovibrio axinellae]|uniref:Uncharacterized protein n=1 Tax=Pseudovibrio axinellae TaxID=989403 RepID=A0A165WQT3_9HYPH|nr:methylamine utilization protein MauJ [Pseudovibrio axinellae]KZL16797.1 hypothetical protein PsAD2_03414 [Pseudovibrio axinellae]SER70051.1 hypothetical protein SAMN05421798_11714 [Pseudovibrio axinellae]
MMKPETLDIKDVWTGALKRTGNWVVANIDTSVSWPTKLHTIIHEGIHYWIIPVTKDAYPGVAACAEDITAEELQKRTLQFLSVISWVDSRSIVVNSFTMGDLPRSKRRGHEGGYAIREEFDYPYLPKIEDNQAKLALALMREGRELNHAAFSFLNYFRVCEVAYSNSEDRKKWMIDAIVRIQESCSVDAPTNLKAKGVLISGYQDSLALDALTNLKKRDPKEVSKHLFEASRCAIAHAGKDPIINPDDPADINRLSSELPLIEFLAVLAIEEKFGVKTTSTIDREHLYELEGFKKAFGSELVEKLKSSEQIQGDLRVGLPVISLRLRGRPSFPSLEGLLPKQMQQVGSNVQLSYGKEDGSLGVKFNLNFKDEQLEFDIHDGIYGISDDESADYAETKAQMIEFFKWYYLNGSLEIVDTETGEEISRKDAFLPVNVLVNPEEFDKDIKFWLSTADTRRKIESTT